MRKFMLNYLTKGGIKPCDAKELEGAAGPRRAQEKAAQIPSDTPGPPSNAQHTISVFKESRKL